MDDDLLPKMDNRSKKYMKRTPHDPSRVGIVGLGLIGGSLGLDLQALGWEVHGLTHKTSTANRARSRGLAQVISTDPNVLIDCDLVILALPLAELLQPAQELINALPQKAVVTDVGSVKAPVLKLWSELHPNFVASHPMAGNALAGVEAGQKGLFQKRPWIITPNSNTNQQALDVVQQLAKSLDCQLITTEAIKHDKAVALISHLPVLVSAALLTTLNKEQDPTIRNLAIAIASSGFEDTTRVGGGNPNLGTAMVENNTAAILQSLLSYRSILEQIEKAIVEKNWAELHKGLVHTQTIKSFLPSEQAKLIEEYSLDTLD